MDRDHHSGAAELALRAVRGLQAWLRRHPRPAEMELQQVARLLCRSQPLMAPMRNLANQVALAAATPHPAAALRASLKHFQHIAGSGPSEIARRFRLALARGPRRRIVTYSYSSTVLGALIAARSRIAEVICSEAAPEREGVTMARRLARAGVRTCLTTDTCLPGFLDSRSPMLLVVGADQVRERTFVNRQGTELLVERSRKRSHPCWVLADTTKFIPGRRMGMPATLAGWTAPLLPRPVRNLRAARQVLAPSPLAPNVRVLTEHGWMTPQEVRRAIARITISPRLRALLD
jgi:translation initiation factor 2B subunit (eIF-2B alpha/beta/delta family)